MRLSLRRSPKRNERYSSARRKVSKSTLPVQASALEIPRNKLLPRPQSKRKLFPRAFSRSKAQKPTYRDLGRTVRQERQRTQRFRFTSSASHFLWRLLRSGWLIIVGAIVLTLLLLAGWYLHQVGTYTLATIEVAGNQQVAAEEILQELNYLVGKSMFSFSTGEVEARLRNKFPYIKSVQAQKELPGTLILDLEERFPTWVFVNMAGAYVLDEDGVIISIINSENLPALSSKDALIFNGYGDPNASYVHQRYLLALANDNERDKVVWKEVDPSLKTATLELLRTEVVEYVEGKFSELREMVMESEFSRLPIIEGFEVNATTDAEGKRWYKVYALGEQYDLQLLEISDRVREYLRENRLQIQRMRWETSFTLRVQLRNGVTILFTSTKPIEIQIDVLQALRSQRLIRNARIIDLRSELVSVK